jgi:hypothetical protein
MTDNSVREYLALEQKYSEVIHIVEAAMNGERVNITDVRRALDDIYNAGRDKGPAIETPRRPLSYEISDNIVLVMGGGTSEKGARQHTENLVNAAKEHGFKQGYAEAKRKVLLALTGKEV